MEDDLNNVLTQWVQSSVRGIEFGRQFGQRGEVVNELLKGLQKRYDKGEISYKQFITKTELMREKIRLMSSAGTGHYYTTTKNKRLHPEKMETKKYDPKVRKHVLYKEAKIK